MAISFVMTPVALAVSQIAYVLQYTPIKAIEYKLNGHIIESHSNLQELNRCHVPVF